MTVPKMLMLDFFKKYVSSKMDRENLEGVISLITEYNPFVEINGASVKMKVSDMSASDKAGNILGQFEKVGGNNYIYINDKFLDKAVYDKVCLFALFITIGHENTHFLQSVIVKNFDSLQSNKEFQKTFNDKAGMVLKQMKEKTLTKEEIESIYGMLKPHMSPFFTMQIQDMSQDERNSMFSALEYAYYFQQYNEIHAEMSGIMFAVNIFDYVYENSDDLEVKSFCVEALDYLQAYKEDFCKTFNDTLDKTKTFNMELLKINPEELIDLGNKILFDEDTSKGLKHLGIYSDYSKTLTLKKAINLYANTLTPQRCKELYEIGLKMSCPTFYLPMLDSLKFRLPKKDFDKVIEETIDVLSTDKHLNKQAFNNELYNYLNLEKCIDLSKKLIKAGRLNEQYSLMKNVVFSMRFSRTDVTQFITESLTALRKNVDTAIRRYKKGVYDENYLTLEDAYQQFNLINKFVTTNTKYNIPEKTQELYKQYQEKLSKYRNMDEILTPTDEERARVLTNIYGEDYAEYEKKFEEAECQKFANAMQAAETEGATPLLLK